MIQRWCSLATWLALQTLHPANGYLVDAVAPKPHVFLVVADDLGRFCQLVSSPDSFVEESF